MIIQMEPELVELGKQAAAPLPGMHVVDPVIEAADGIASKAARGFGVHPDEQKICRAVGTYRSSIWYFPAEEKRTMRWRTISVM